MSKEIEFDQTLTQCNQTYFSILMYIYFDTCQCINSMQCIVNHIVLLHLLLNVFCVSWACAHTHAPMKEGTQSTKAMTDPDHTRFGILASQ